MTEQAKAGFTCPYCGKRFDTFDELKHDILTSHRGMPLPAQEGQVRLVINGQVHVVQVEPEWTLYHLIHDHLGMTGSKQFCDRGACG
mgnify:FL=1